jgi:hypothetical protein
VSSSLKEYSDYQGTQVYVTVLDTFEELEKWFEGKETEIPEKIRKIN